jgi:predicted phosphodiesterase
MKPTTKADIARKYRDEYGMEMPTLKLARIMHSRENLTFNDVEDARSVLRCIEGKKGKSKCSKVTHAAPDRPRNPYSLPDSDETIFEPYVITGHNRVAVLSDIHVPYHSISALTAAIEFCKKDKVDALLLNGDTLDAFQLSRFCRDPKKRHFAEELKVMKELIEVFQRELKCKIYFKYGNHSERYEHFLWTKAKELVGIEEFELDNLIKARVNGIEIIKDKRIIKLNGLNVIHGHEYTQGIFNPVNVARGLFLRGKTSAMQSHSHQTSEHTESDMNGKITTTWSTGCLCELNPEYMPLNKWNHGFAIVDLYDDSFDVRNKRVHKGKVL